MKLYDNSVLRLLQERLLPIERAGEQIDAIEGVQPDARRAAVLIALFERDQELFLVLIRRSANLRSHSGEIAFPGGSIDPTDHSPIMAALREAQEEIGLDPERVAVLGLLSPVFTVGSNFLVTPVVAFLPHGLGELRLQASEVTELIVLPLQGLADPAISHSEQWIRNGFMRTVYFYDYGPYCIWGATGRMLHSLLHMLGEGYTNELPR